MKLNILHLADLHCTTDDAPYLKTVGSALCADLEKMSASGIRPDIVCVTGDLVNKGENASVEFSQADTIFLRPLQKTLGLSESAFFFAPGNHDVDRTQVSKHFEFGIGQDLIDQNTFRQFYHATQNGSPDADLLRKKLAGYLAFVEGYKNANSTHRSYFYDAYKFKVNGLSVGIVSLNSAWRSSQYGEDARKLVIGEHLIIESAAKISDCDIRLCLCHHPFEMLADWDSKPVRQMVARHFHAVLNGHVHDSDAVASRLLLGNLLVSTAGCLKANELFSGYTVIQMDIAKDTVTCLFRKWYKERGQFDQEVAKAPNGKIVFDGIKAVSATASSALQIAVLRGRLQTDQQELEIICPIEGIEEVELREVFVEPLLSDRSGFDRETESHKSFSIDELLKSNANLLIAGRPEFGKTTLLRYSKDFILRNDKYFECKVPVVFRFSDIPKKNPKTILRQIGKNMGQTEVEAEALAASGHLVLLIDDFNDRQDGDHDKRVKLLSEFYQSYPKCRYVLFATEHLAQPLQLELLTLASNFQAKIAYIGSLNTARIRQLLLKWKAKQDFDVDAMLHQILYSFQHCQIPVTPLAVILFLGVLFRKRKERNIRNEAYLIENYLETILEKLSPSQRDADSDFRDKEDFLATVAWEMVQRSKQTLETNEFEKLKIEYFEKQDEDLPHHSFFEAFFKKGILVRDDGIICFSRRLWFHFFIAKALDWSEATKQQFLAREDVLKFGKALAYKAGLSRKDVDLLKWVDERAMKEMQPAIQKYHGFELASAASDAPIQQISDSVVQQLKEKNTDQDVDQRRDEIYLKYDEDKGHRDEQQVDQFDDLITLQSDILRNTTKIGLTEKRHFIDRNVSCYIALMWGGIDAFRDMLQKTDESELFKLFFRGKKDTTMRHKLRLLSELAQRMIHQVVPLSVLVYANEHLGSPKITKSLRRLTESTDSETKKLFYLLLIFGQKPKEGIKDLKQRITPTSSITEDFIICGFVRWYCHENKIDGDVIDKIVDLLDAVRLKYANKIKDDVPMLRDTFRSDTKKQLATQHIR